MPTAFTRDLGRTQGRIAPQNATPFDGSMMVCLGSDSPGQVHEFNDGDGVKLVGTVVVPSVGKKVVRFRARARGPNTPPPAGYNWYFCWGVVDGHGNWLEVQGSRMLAPGKSVDVTDGVISLAVYDGEWNIAFEIKVSS